MKTNDLLLPEQHGFMPGRSTLSNLLSCDAVIADLVAGSHCYDIISFDFLKAFDKAPIHTSSENWLLWVSVGKLLAGL